MDSLEMKFHIHKNILDNEYNESLSYFVNSTIIIATAAISGVQFFLNAGNIESASFALVFAFSLLFISVVHFQKRLKLIKQKISELELQFAQA